VADPLGTTCLIGDIATAILTGRAEAAGVEALALSPQLEGFNEDLGLLGDGKLRASLRMQLTP
jgi:hypothetical protein